ncbi:hypothetical protein RJ55_04454 [Drechmeria coniospora]|nr:hypothetical protein RJ55_04454 [Drechmeria coniospora]
MIGPVSGRRELPWIPNTKACAPYAAPHLAPSCPGHERACTFLLLSIILIYFKIEIQTLPSFPFLSLPFPSFLFLSPPFPSFPLLSLPFPSSPFHIILFLSPLQTEPNAQQCEPGPFFEPAIAALTPLLLSVSSIFVIEENSLCLRYAETQASTHTRNMPALGTDNSFGTTLSPTLDASFGQDIVTMDMITLTLTFTFPAPVRATFHGTSHEPTLGGAYQRQSGHPCSDHDGRR